MLYFHLLTFVFIALSLSFERTSAYCCGCIYTLELKSVCRDGSSCDFCCAFGSWSVLPIDFISSILEYWPSSTQQYLLLQLQRRLQMGVWKQEHPWKVLAVSWNIICYRLTCRTVHSGRSRSHDESRYVTEVLYGVCRSNGLTPFTVTFLLSLTAMETGN